MVVLGGVLIVTGLLVLAVEAHASTGGILGLAGVQAAAAGIGLVLVGAAVPLVLAVAAALAGVGAAMTLMMARAVVVAPRCGGCVSMNAGSCSGSAGSST